GDVGPGWGTEYTETGEGITFKLHPKATFADGTPADAEAVRLNLEGFMGQFVQQASYQAPLWNSANAKENIESVQVISPTEVFVKTKGPKPTFMWNFGGNGYHTYWYGNPQRLLKGPAEYLKAPAGGGPYKIKRRTIQDQGVGPWQPYRVRAARRLLGRLPTLAQAPGQDHGDPGRPRSCSQIRDAKEWTGRHCL